MFQWPDLLTWGNMSIQRFLAKTNPGEGNVAFNATPNPVLLNKICLNQDVLKGYARLVNLMHINILTYADLNKFM